LPLFTEQDVENVMRRFRPIPYERPTDIEDLRVRFMNSGHILGSALAEIEHVSERHTLVFSGDLGRYGVPLHRDPEALPHCETLILESTYGDRDHDGTPLEDQLLRAIHPTLDRRGTVLIPSFAVARAQLLGLLIGRLISEGRLPPVPVDVDSPMATDVTEVYRRYANDVHLDDDIRARTLVPATVHYRRSVAESKSLNDLEGPRIIIASAGMLTGGRVLHHLARLAPDPANLIILAGYQAAGTRGRSLLSGAQYLRVHGFDVAVRAKVVSLDGFSAHADRRELLRWVETAPARPKNVFIVHGEAGSSAALATDLRQRGYHAIEPHDGERFALTEGGSWRSAGIGNATA